MTTKIPVSTIVPFGLRLQPDLKLALEDAAKVSGRSLNAEIAARLQASLEEKTDLSSANVGQLVSELMRRFPGQCQISFGKIENEDEDS